MDASECAGGAADIVNVYPKAGSYLAPLKKVQIDDGILSYQWWPGNETLKGRALPTGLEYAAGRGLTQVPTTTEDSATFDAAAGGQLELPISYDLEKGVVLEATLAVAAHDASLSSAGLMIETVRPWSGSLAIADNAGRFSIGSYNGYAFRAADSKPVPASSSQRWRVLIKNTLVEYYIDDAFVQAFTLPEAPPADWFSSLRAQQSPQPMSPCTR